MFLFLSIVFICCTSPALADDFVLSGDGDVADLSSGLIWQGSSAAVRSAPDAVSFCARVDGATDPGWRLPTQAELATLQSNLNGIAPTTYWATRNDAPGTGVYCFGDGAFFAAPVRLESALVRCVRENPLAPVIEAVNVWVESWQNGNVDGYLSSYRKDFRPGSGVKHSAWEQQRRLRLLSARDLMIDLQTERISALNERNVEIVFLQDYRSRHYRDRVRKRLVLSQLRGRWLISREEQLSSLPLQAISAASSVY